MKSLKQIYGIILACIEKLIGIDAAKKFDSFIRFHRKLNLKQPTSLADKVCYIELHKQSALASMCTDKFEVRKYIQSKGLQQILVPLAGGPWTNIGEIDFSKIETPCVFKGTHGCKMTYFMVDRDSFDIDACKKEMKRWLETTYGIYSIEPHYKAIPHRIYAESYLGKQSELVDYKFHCMNGKPIYVLAVRDRVADGDKKMRETRELYDIDWNPIQGLKSSQTRIENYKILAEDFDFVRVDLYNIKGNIFFGELTFTPTSGVFPSYTDEFINMMGEKLTI